MRQITMPLPMYVGCIIGTLLQGLAIGMLIGRVL